MKRISILAICKAKWIHGDYFCGMLFFPSVIVPIYHFHFFLSFQNRFVNWKERFVVGQETGSLFASSPKFLCILFTAQRKYSKITSQKEGGVLCRWLKKKERR